MKKMHKTTIVMMIAVIVLSGCSRSKVHPLLARDLDCGSYRVKFSASEMTSTDLTSATSRTSFTSRYILVEDPPEYYRQYPIRLDLQSGAAVSPVTGGEEPTQIFFAGLGSGGVQFMTSTGFNGVCEFVRRRV